MFTKYINTKVIFTDCQSLDNTDVDAETGNTRTNNNIDCEAIPSQTTLVKACYNVYRTALQWLNNKQRCYSMSNPWKYQNRN